MPRPDRFLDYLINMIQCLELLLKVLSVNWQTHDVGKMYKDFFKRDYVKPKLMEDLKSALMDQKYLLKPSAGLINHIPELEAQFDELYKALKEQCPKYHVSINQELPDSIARYLIENVARFYDTGSITVLPNSSQADLTALSDDLCEFRDREIESIRSNLETFISQGMKLRLAQGSGGMT